GGRVRVTTTCAGAGGGSDSGSTRAAVSADAAPASSADAERAATGNTGTACPTMSATLSARTIPTCVRSEENTLVRLMASGLVSRVAWGERSDFAAHRRAHLRHRPRIRRFNQRNDRRCVIVRIPHRTLPPRRIEREAVHPVQHTVTIRIRIEGIRPDLEL